MNTRINGSRFQLGLTALAGPSHKALPSAFKELSHRYLTSLGRQQWGTLARLQEEAFQLQLSLDLEPYVFKNIRQAFSWHEKIVLNGDRRAKEAALQKFMKYERRCRHFNYFLRRKTPAELSALIGVPFFVSSVQQHIRTVLGSLSSAYSHILYEARNGPGMTLSSKRSAMTSLPYKLTDHPSCTIEALPIWVDFLSSNKYRPEWWNIITQPDGSLAVTPRVRVVTSCRVSTVPKTPDIDRTIAIEPSANVMLQLGVHEYLRSRLARIGVNIGDQSRNRSLALEGSKDSSYATIDLSGASDTVSRSLVALLLPGEWSHFLDLLRSHAADLGDSTIQLEKFSSMGNGFTFALETLIFWAIARSSLDSVGSQDELSVYGDDIIVPRLAFDLTIRALRVFGFIPNLKKTFSSGYFRESCGLDAYRGVVVRPVFPRSLSMRIDGIIDLHNRLQTAGLHEESRILVASIPSELRLFGPVSPTPRGWFMTSDESKLRSTKRRWSSDLQTHLYPGYSVQGVRRRFRAATLLECSLLAGGLWSLGAPLRSTTNVVIRYAPG